MTNLEKLEATPLAMKIIAGLLLAMIGLGSAWAIDVNAKLEHIIEINATQDRQIFVNTGKIEERTILVQSLQADIREIRSDVKKLLERP
jgi:Tfp pilus assembly protein PilO